MHLYLDTVVSSTPDYSAGIYMRVTFMSFTMAWNNPPSAPHSFSTVSMVAKKKKQQKASREEENLAKYPSVQTASSIRCVDLRFVPPPFLVLCSEPAATAAERMPTLSSLTDTHKKKKPETILFSFDGTGSLRSPRSAAATRLWGAREGWSRDALQPGSWKGTCGSDRRDRGANRNNRENTMC